ncbi:MAG: tRNA (guanosine(37)-N1)-methyltransferase TrmD [Muribaculaceae bacterium]|nr:tRNA (guanosine(37)-N1)-methyltransferase TrmD [Roseburia sp.]MCM1431145.1 tRNA (guanosine(37)-N1)-methyltransferase TrmD [Muribaculaceae bacterium]MCM1492568.1 tRNA (guanosine(37)-N1)-methyltransferase TrmD [Muribaculaceae bacterium]
MDFYILTLFPEMVESGLHTSITGRAIQQNKIAVHTVNIRDFTENKHGRVDDYTYGGGAGMLMQAQPVYDAFCSVRQRIPAEHKSRVIYVTPQGRPFTQSVAEELAESDELVLLCGHYEGVDERVLEEIATDYISIGDYVLTGGELAAMVIVDAVARLVPLVLHNEDSAKTESFYGNLLEYPQYSRPEEWRGKRVPSVLLSGNQREIDVWRKEQAKARTAERRPDLYAVYQALETCEACLLSDKLHHMDMIELIRRGRAKLVARQGKEILLEDKESHIFFHTCLEEPRSHGRDSALLPRLQELCGHDANVIVLHQPESVPALAQMGYCADMECLTCVYTKKEQLPITGLYRADGQPSANGIEIFALTLEEFPLVEQCCTVGKPEYLRKRIEKGMMYGARMQGELAGFIGVHGEGSMGMLYVLPRFRRRKVAAALETYLCNWFIRQKMTPYGQIAIGSTDSVLLQEKLGLCMSGGHVYWMSLKSSEQKSK